MTTTLSQPVKIWFVKKEDNDRRHGLFMRAESGETLHIHVSPYNMKRMISEKRNVDARAFIRMSESSESVLPADELVQELEAMSAEHNRKMSEIDVAFDETEIRISSGDKLLNTIEFGEEEGEEADILVAAIKMDEVAS